MLTDTPHEEEAKMTKAFLKTTNKGRTPARVARGVRSNRVVRLRLRKARIVRWGVFKERRKTGTAYICRPITKPF